MIKLQLNSLLIKSLFVFRNFWRDQKQSPRLSLINATLLLNTGLFHARRMPPWPGPSRPPGALLRGVSGRVGCGCGWRLSPLCRWVSGLFGPPPPRTNTVAHFCPCWGNFCPRRPLAAKLLPTFALRTAGVFK